MKIRITLMTENDAVIDTDKETIENVARRGWQYLLDMINCQAVLEGKNEKAYIEKLELVEDDIDSSTTYREPDLDPIIIKD